MFQLDDDEYELNEEFLEDIFQLTGPQKAADNGNSNHKNSENIDSEFPIPDIGDGKKSIIVEDRAYRLSTSSNSSPVSKKAKFPCGSDQSLLPAEQGFLELRSEGNLLLSGHKNSGFLSKDAGLDNVNNRKSENFFGGTSTNSFESFKFSPRLPSNRVENVNQHDFNISPHNVRRRKFPGPAGLLPELDKRKCYPDLSQVPLESVERKCHFLSNDLQDEPGETLSQPCAVGSLFDNNSPWGTLRQDFGLNTADAHRNPLSKICLKWARQKASARQLPAHKVPFLAIAIHALDCSSPDPCVILRDPTGEMGGTLHREVWECYGYLLHPGAAMALRQVGVLSTGAAARRHYLNITENNLLSIYSSAKLENGLNNFGKGDEMFTSDIKITKIRPLDMNEVKRSLTDMQNISQSSASSNILPSSSTLYSSVSTGPRIHSPITNSARSAPYRAPFSSNLNRFNSQRPSNLASGQPFSPGFRSPVPSPHQNSFVPSPMQSDTWGIAGNSVSMDIQCSNSPSSSIHIPASSSFTPKLPVSSMSPLGAFVPKQPFLNKLHAGQLGGSPSVPYHPDGLGSSSPNMSLTSQECATAMDVSIGPCVSKPVTMNHSGSSFEKKGVTSIAGAECEKSQAIEEAELDSILGGIDTDLLFDDNDF